MVPGTMAQSFEDNLCSLPGHGDVGHVAKLVIPAKERRRALHDLFDMNISRTSLFPGLDGYATSLGIYHPTVFDPIRWNPDTTSPNPSKSQC